MNARKPCEYCAADLPVGVDRKTRRMRSHHFAICPKRPQVRGGEVVGLSMDEAWEMLAAMTQPQREALAAALKGTP